MAHLQARRPRQRPARRQLAGEDVTYLRFAFCGQLGQLQAGRRLDHGIVRTLWLTPDEIRASRAQHRSRLVVQCMEDYLNGQRHPLSLLHTDPSVTTALPSATGLDHE